VSLQEGQNIDGHRGPSPTTWQDEPLVARAQNGEQWAIEELVRRYQQKAYAIAYHMCGEDPQEAEDFTQEAFLRIFRNLGKFRGDSSFYTWFYRIVVNVCLDGKRRRRRWQRIFSPWQHKKSENDPSRKVSEDHPDLEDRTDSVTLLSSKQLSEDIRKSLISLPETQRMVFQLKVLHGMRIREIAQIMGVAEGTVKSHLFRATRFLRETLKEWAQP
jgi:RNA polymerase sigma-70 factor (ECF subfamily)